MLCPVLGDRLSLYGEFESYFGSGCGEDMPNGEKAIRIFSRTVLEAALAVSALFPALPRRDPIKIVSPA